MQTNVWCDIHTLGLVGGAGVSGALQRLHIYLLPYLKCKDEQSLSNYNHKGIYFYACFCWGNEEHRSISQIAHF